MKKLVMLLSLTLVTAGLPTPTAKAHNFQDWSDSLWYSGPGFTQNEYWFSDSTGWTQAQLDAFDNADHAWDAVSSGPSWSWTARPNGPRKDWTGCDGNNNSVAEKVGQQSWNGKVETCESGGQIYKVWIRINTYTGIYAGYWGSSVPEPTHSDIAFQGTLAHEFGHAWGFLGHWQDGGAGTSGLCDQSAPQSGWQTMCQGSWWDSNGYPVENYDLTLEAHDIHTFQNAY